jgi:integrase
MGPRQLPTGVRRRTNCLQVYAKVNGQFVSKQLPLDSDDAQLKEARRRLVNRHKYGVPDDTEPGGTMFAADAKQYLALVEHMPSYDDRAYEIAQWGVAFRGRVRSSITAVDIRRQLEKWRKSGRADGKGGLAHASLNRRRTALMSLWTTLDGKSAPNPVRDVPEYDESDNEQIRAFDPRLLYRIIGRVARLKYTKRPYVLAHKTRARLRLMLWLGWPQAQIMKIAPEHVNWKEAQIYAMPRKKGKGTKGRWLPLLPGAVVALKAFFAAKATGKFSTSAMHSAFARGLAAENAFRAKHKRPPIDGCYPYTLRHTFGTELAKRLTDERAIQELMLHATPALTRRYTDAATSARLEAARDVLMGRKVAQEMPALVQAKNAERNRQE